MQHLDEGTIHSWLDGALSVDEAARVEAHLKECRECAAAVAEARGFIAASSRILTALDNAPRGVIPVAAPIRRRNWVVWRAAAAVLVVAGGSLVVLRNTGRESQVLSPAYQARSSNAPGPSTVDSDGSIRTTPEPSSAKSLPTRIPIGRAHPSGSVSENITQAPASAEVTSALKADAPTPRVSDQKEVRAPAFKPKVVAREGAGVTVEAGGVAGGVAAGRVVGASGYAAPAAPPAAAPAPLVSGIGIRGASSLAMPADSAPLKVVGNPRRIGAKVTLYEVAPGDTVTLTELTQLSLDAVVVTGTSVARGAQQGATEKSAAAPARARADAANKVAADSQRAAEAALAPAAQTALHRTPAPVEVVDGVTTISWIDATTGNELKLSGRLSVSRLQQVKIRIERERAAAAAVKKAP